MSPTTHVNKNTAATPLSVPSVLPKEITTKLTMHRLLKDGVFGNCLKLYDSIKQAVSNPASLLYLRVSRPAFEFHPVGFPISELEHNLQKMRELGVGREEIFIGEANHPSWVTANMEVRRTEIGLYVYWSPRKLRMRDSLALGMNHAWGLEAKCVLDHFLSPCSRTNLDRLLDQWPDHVVELTAHDRFLGDVPGNNSVFWEVRKY